MTQVLDIGARREIAGLRQRIEQLEGRIPVVLPQADRFAVILDLVAAEFAVERTALLSARREAPLALARQVAMALASRGLNYSLPRIGRLLGRDHSTVLHGIRRVAALARDDADFAARLDALAARINLGRKVA